MGAELVLFIGYALLLTTGLFWIALDAETAYIFDVFGKNFDYMWRDSGHRWKYTLMYGWRLIAVLLFIGACVYSSWHLAALVRWLPGSIALFIVLAAVALYLVPWIRVANRLRFQRTLRRTAVKLTPVAERFARTADPSSMYDDAHYQTAPTWSAWHPKSSKEWPVVVPVAYVHAPPSAAVLFPVDWECFLAWKLGNQLPSAGSMLPFNGPGDSAFVLRGVWPLRGAPNWSIMQVELQFD